MDPLQITIPIIFNLFIYLGLVYSYRWVFKSNNITDWKMYVPFYNMKILANIVESNISFYLFISGFITYLVNLLIYGYSALQSRPDSDYTNLHNVFVIIPTILIATSLILFFKSFARKYNYEGKELIVFYASITCHAICLIYLFTPFTSITNISEDGYTVMDAPKTVAFCLGGILTLIELILLVAIPEKINRHHKIQSSHLPVDQDEKIELIPKSPFWLWLDAILWSGLLIFCILGPVEYFYLALFPIPRRKENAPNFLSEIKSLYLEKKYLELVTKILILLSVTASTIRLSIACYLFSQDLFYSILAGIIILLSIYSVYKFLRVKKIF